MRADTYRRLTDRLIAVAELFADHYGISLSQLSNLAADSGSCLDDVRAGSLYITVDRMERILYWLALFWPDELPWPEDVDQPPVEFSRRALRDYMMGSRRRGRRKAAA
jgi:hypothetical protein